MKSSWLRRINRLRFDASTREWLQRQLASPTKVSNGAPAEAEPVQEPLFSELPAGPSRKEWRARLIAEQEKWRR